MENLLLLGGNFSRSFFSYLKIDVLLKELPKWLTKAIRSWGRGRLQASKLPCPLFSVEKFVILTYVITYNVSRVNNKVNGGGKIYFCLSIVNFRSGYPFFQAVEPSGVSFRSC